MIKSKANGDSKSCLKSDTFQEKFIGQLFRHRNVVTDSTVHDPLSVGVQGVTPQLDKVAKSLKNDGRKLVRRGDLVINSRSDRRGASGLSDREGSVSQIYIVLEPNPKQINPRFAHHLIRSKGFQEEFYRFGTGIVADLWSTRYERMAQIRVPIPSLEVQRRIADYLDRETAEIDAAVADLDKYVELLEKRRLLVADEVLQSQGALKSGKNEIPFKLLIRNRFVGDWGEEPGVADVDAACVRVADFNRSTNRADAQVPTVRSYMCEKFEAKRLRYHDILIERSGGGDKTPVGGAMLYTGEGKALCANFIEVVRLNDDQLPEYWVHVLSREYMGRKTMKLSLIHI